MENITEAFVWVVVLTALIGLATWIVSKVAPISFEEGEYPETEDDFPEFSVDDWYVRRGESGYEYNPDFKE